MSMLKFYNNKGDLVLVQEGKFLFFPDGEPWGQIENQAIYLIKNRKLAGYLKDNWIFDESACYRFFSEKSIGGIAQLPPKKPSFVAVLKPVIPISNLPVNIMGVPNLVWSKQQNL